MPNLLDAPQRRPPKERGPRPLTISFPMFWRTSAADLDPDFSPNPDSAVPEARSAKSTRTSRNRTHQTTPSNSQRRRSNNEANEAHLSPNEVGLDEVMGADMEEADGVRRTGEGPRQDRPASQGKRIRRRYYRLYCSLGAIPSVEPTSAHDRSLSSFDVEHVSPPRLARNYIAYISHREHLTPSAVKLYLTPQQGSPELVTNLDTVIVMDGMQRFCGHSKRRPLLFTVEASEISRRRYPSPYTLKSVPHLSPASELPVAYYRLYGVAATSRGAQRPLASRSPIYETDPSLASLFIDSVSPPLRAKDYIAYICELEGIHPSRVTLFLRARAVREEVSSAAEAQKVQNDEDIITSRTASLTSEDSPIMVSVVLEVGAYGDLDLDKKSTPLSIEEPPSGGNPPPGAGVGFVLVNVRPLPSIPGSSGSHSPAAEASSNDDQVDRPVPGSEPPKIPDPAAKPPGESAPLNPRRRSSSSARAAQPAPVDEPFDEFDAVGDKNRVIPPQSGKAPYGNGASARPLSEVASTKGPVPPIPERDHRRAGRNTFPAIPPTSKAQSSSADPPYPLPLTAPLNINNTNQAKLDASQERPNLNRRPSGSSFSSRPQSQRFYSASEQPIQDSRPGFPPAPPPKEAQQAEGQRRESTALSLMSVMGEQMKGFSPFDGVTSERSRGGVGPTIGGLPLGAAMRSAPSLVHEVGLPRRGKEFRKGYYRLYTPSGILFSANPIYKNDISLSTFDIEHVPPPRLAENYIAYIAQREHLRPSGVQMYITRTEGNPEPVPSPQTAINMDHLDKDCGRTRQRPLLFVVQPNSELISRRYPPNDVIDSLPLRDLASELSVAHYRIFGLAQASKGGQRPMPSHSPVYQDDPSLGRFFIDYVPPPLRAKDYIAHIGELTDIHPSRIRLYVRWKSAGSETTAVAEAREIYDGDVLGAKIASSTSELEPLLVNVELELDDYGDLDFGTKSLPVPRLTFKGITGRLSRRLSKWRR
ncbi:hypothetical protein FS837_011816 [Tulasnella sp. UAMH 9824]|nr:hypothetical protein FS837_011816 [Tulasnella sp. UAMH 9824]